PLALDSGSCAKRVLIGEKRPTYVAGLDRGVRPIGPWSMLMTLSMASTPSIESKEPSASRVGPTLFERIGYRRSESRVDFPEPETPVMAMNVPSGKPTVIFLRLCSCAPCITMLFPFPDLRSRGRWMTREPERYCPVRERGLAHTSLSVPAATT